MSFLCLQLFQKTNLKIQIFALAYWGRNFSFGFWKNWKKQNVLSKLIDFYILSLSELQPARPAHYDRRGRPADDHPCAQRRRRAGDTSRNCLHNLVDWTFSRWIPRGFVLSSPHHNPSSSAKALSLPLSRQNRRSLATGGAEGPLHSVTNWS